MRDRARPDRGLRDLVEFALPFEFGLAQCLADQLRRFRKARPRFFHRNAEPLVFDARRTAAKAEQAAPAGEDVQQRDPLGDADRVVPRQHDDRRPEHDPLGAAGIIGQQLERRRRHRIAGEMVLEREQRVEAERLGEIAHRQMVGDDRHVGARRLGQHVERNTDFHCGPPQLRFTTETRRSRSCSFLARCRDVLRVLCASVVQISHYFARRRYQGCG